MAVEELAQRVLSGPSVEGITFLGGEPFEQAVALAALARRLRTEGLSVMTFTGLQFEDLSTGREPGWLELLAETDLLVDGAFREELPETERPWVGSSNQRFHFLTPRYRALVVQLATIPNRFEVSLTAEGGARVNGMGPVAEVLKWFSGEDNLLRW